MRGRKVKVVKLLSQWGGSQFVSNLLGREGAITTVRPGALGVRVFFELEGREVGFCPEELRYLNNKRLQVV